ncbi:hypothetical protein [Frigoriglobus tundricola]|uniref:Uncharacterized protein n=1 Tax=Frigoriglobus tundricola TaxID=2774151 RepID=A0A6M5YVM5_9BACT|nr:hypothetical protein [Frigoriglobus tundricola]QJW98075.1 hypothetical protein FTUN_5655 [Frigoriglobus tundricola]
MTRQVSWPVAAAVAAVLLGGGAVNAQPPSGFGSRPAYSPYLNLNRPGGSVTQNYYGLVRPEVQARQSVGSLQGSVAANQQAIGGLQAGITAPPELPVTGHQATFLNYRSYFLSGGVAGTGAGGTSFRTAAPASARR